MPSTHYKQQFPPQVRLAIGQDKHWFLSGPALPLTSTVTLKEGSRKKGKEWEEKGEGERVVFEPRRWDSYAVAYWQIL